MLENIWAVEGLFSKYMLSRMSERRGLPETLMKYPDLGTGRRGVAGKYSGYHKLQILVCCISSMLLCFFFFFWLFHFAKYIYFCYIGVYEYSRKRWYF